MTLRTSTVIALHEEDATITYRVTTQGQGDMQLTQSVTLEVTPKTELATQFEPLNAAKLPMFHTAAELWESVLYGTKLNTYVGRIRMKITSVRQQKKFCRQTLISTGIY